jgi:hypothetical protein
MTRSANKFPMRGVSATCITDTFPIVRRKDEAKWGEYRTKRIILEIYDAMGESIRTAHPCQTLLDPPPADPSVAHAGSDGRGLEVELTKRGRVSLERTTRV